MAKKGFLKAEITTHDNMVFHLYNLHAISGDSEGELYVGIDPRTIGDFRVEQFKQLLLYISSCSYGMPVVIVGDFNSKNHPDYARYPEIKQMLNNAGFRPSWSSQELADDRLDQIWTLDQNKIVFSPNNLTFHDEADIRDYTDHDAVSLELQWDFVG